MKKIITCLVIGISVLTLQSCKEKKKTETTTDEIAADKVPAPVKAAFNTKYATASGVIWEDANENDKQSYKAKFTLNGKKMKAEFDASGVLIKEKEDD